MNSVARFGLAYDMIARTLHGDEKQGTPTQPAVGGWKHSAGSFGESLLRPSTGDVSFDFVSPAEKKRHPNGTPKFSSGRNFFREKAMKRRNNRKKPCIL